MILPFWNSELYIDIASWFPFGKDFQPVSVNNFYDENLKSIADSCFEFESELFFMVSPLTGCIGNFTRDNFFRSGPDGYFNLGFMLLLGYSEYIERIVCAALGTLESGRELTAGIASCALWEKGVFTSKAKAIAIVSDEPFFECADFLKGFSEILKEARKYKIEGGLSYFAEKFGYSRFFISWETDDPVKLKMSRLLSEFEFGETRQITGPSPEISFPPFLGVVMGGFE